MATRIRNKYLRTFFHSCTFPFLSAKSLELAKFPSYSVCFKFLLIAECVLPRVALAFSLSGRGIERNIVYIILRCSFRSWALPAGVPQWDWRWMQGPLYWGSLRVFGGWLDDCLFYALRDMDGSLVNFGY